MDRALAPKAAWVALLLCVGCGEQRPAPAGTLIVEPADPGPIGGLAEGDGEADEQRTGAGVDASADDSATSPETSNGGDGGSDVQSPVSGVGGALGLRVVASDGSLVGVLVARGHGHQGAGTAPAGAPADPLRDGVLVYHPVARVFFGVAMASGKVIAPRLGIAGADCLTPNVAGYYTDGPEVSGFDYAFVWKGKWWRIQGGEPLALVGCAGVGTGGEKPNCVPHTGSCRGFPVEPASLGLPAAFSAPLRFDWAGAGG